MKPEQADEEASSTPIGGAGIRGSVRTPPLLYGTAWKKHETAALVTKAIAHGFRGIDTACQPKHYHESGVGEAVAGCLSRGLARAELYLQTKFTPLAGQDAGRVPYDPGAPLAEQVIESARVSLRNLQTDYLDCLVLHSPLDTPQRTLEAWRAMEALAADGVVRQLGISNCYDLRQLAWLHQEARVKPAVVQNRFYAATGYDFEIRAFCARRDIGYQSFWTLTANPHLLAHHRITSAASRHGRTPAQILFRYLTQQGVVPLTGTRSELHMREALQIFDFVLTDSERAEISALVDG